MRRSPIALYRYGIYKHFPLFVWKLCDNCRQEFRREWGWRFLTGPFFNGRGSYRYLCKSCAPTKEIANNYAVNGCYIKAAPPAPPSISTRKLQL